MDDRIVDPENQIDLMESFKGSFLYIAPEVLHDDLYTNKVDVYSFAITFY